MPFTIVQGDLTTMTTDAIVNAANTELQPGGGVCGAIYRAAGHEQLHRATRPLAPIQTGEAVLTDGFDLAAKYIIHTAGPVYVDGTHGEAEQLAATYRNSLLVAKEHGLKSIAFPLLSAGIYGYPKEEALRIAERTVNEFLEENEMDVFLVLYNAE